MHLVSNYDIIQVPISDDGIMTFLMPYSHSLHYFCHPLVSYSCVLLAATLNSDMRSDDGTNGTKFINARKLLSTVKYMTDGM